MRAGAENTQHPFIKVRLQTRGLILTASLHVRPAPWESFETPSKKSGQRPCHYPCLEGLELDDSGPPPVLCTLYSTSPGAFPEVLGYMRCSRVSPSPVPLAQDPLRTCLTETGRLGWKANPLCPAFDPDCPGPNLVSVLLTPERFLRLFLKAPSSILVVGCCSKVACITTMDDGRQKMRMRLTTRVLVAISSRDTELVALEL